MNSCIVFRFNWMSAKPPSAYEVWVDTWESCYSHYCYHCYCTRKQLFYYNYMLMYYNTQQLFACIYMIRLMFAEPTLRRLFYITARRITMILYCNGTSIHLDYDLHNGISDSSVQRTELWRWSSYDTAYGWFYFLWVHFISFSTSFSIKIKQKSAGGIFAVIAANFVIADYVRMAWLEDRNEETGNTTQNIIPQKLIEKRSDWILS